MKKFYLSTPVERIGGVGAALAAAAALVALTLSLRGNTAMFVLTAIGSAMIVMLLALYIFGSIRAACIYDEAGRTLRITGLKTQTVDLNRAVLLETIPTRSGNVVSRALLFRDAEDQTVAVVPTYFTTRSGIQAEPMAKQMAQELGLSFRANVELWEYDAEARKAHDEELARLEKEESKRQREGRKALREAKFRQRIHKLRKEK